MLEPNYSSDFELEIGPTTFIQSTLPWSNLQALTERKTKRLQVQHVQKSTFSAQKTIACPFVFALFRTFVSKNYLPCKY